MEHVINGIKFKEDEYGDIDISQDSGSQMSIPQDEIENLIGFLTKTRIPRMDDL